ncbi:PAS domain-containing protein [Sphingomonas sp. PB2P12]|uniref:PAS domain-containing protein n=1 Tax=Sphingomonas sandaracina TaxID=3096157 RepID=UPI002FC8863E
MQSHLLDRDELLARQAFQLALVDMLRGLDRPDLIMAASAATLGSHLGVARCGYGEVVPDGTALHIAGDWTSGALRSLAGETRLLSAFGTGLLDDLRAGKTVIVDDCHTDPRSSDPDYGAAWTSIGACALIVFPLVRHDVLTAILYVHEPEPRLWTPADIALVEDVALRTADAVERSRADVALKASEERFRSLFNSLDAGFCLIELAFGDDRPIDYRFIETNAAFERETGLSDVVGKWMRDLVPDLEERWYEIYARVATTGESTRFEDQATAFDGRWYDVHAYRVDAPGTNRVAVLFNDISERRHKDLELAESRREFELATRVARLGRFDYRARTGRYAWDDRALELFGLPPGAQIDHAIFCAAVHPDDLARVEAAIRVAFDPDGPRRFDIEHRTIGHDDGLERHLVANGMTFFDGREIIRMVGTVVDVTEDRRAQAVLRETSERLRLAARATNDAIWDWDLRRNHVLWNEALTAAYGHELSTVDPTGDWWIAHIHPDDRDRIETSIHAVIDGGGSDWSEEYRFVRADGSYADVLDRGYLIRDDDGAPVRMIGALLDQSARKAVERQLREANEGLEEAVVASTADRDRLWDLSTDIMLRAKYDGTIVAVNPAWAVVLGWTIEEIIGQPLFDLLHPDDIRQTGRAVADLERGEVITRIDNRYRCKDGSYRWINWAAQPGDGMINAVGRDITADKDREARLARAEDALRQAQKMEAVGQLTGGIAHDFNNMLTGIIGGLDMVRRNLPAVRHERVDRYIEAATVSANRAAGLTQRLLAFSRRQSLDVKAVDVGDLVDGMEDLLRRTLGENAGLEVRRRPGIWPAHTDANQLESALLNLAINARDAMPEGGLLTIETENAHLDVHYTETIDDLEPGDFVVIGVSDTGTGMNAAVIAKAFDPFFTTKPIGQGTGLGLSMIYGFARQSGGHVRIYSEEGRGTTVKLYLPRFRGAVEATADTADADLPRADGERVLVVEDDPAVRMLIVDVLQGLGYGVLEAADGRAAVPFLESDQRIDLLVSDVGLPGINGRQVAEIARAHRPGLKVLFVTGYAEKAAVRGDFLDPGMDMITKPFALDVLANRIRAMIGG